MRPTRLLSLLTLPLLALSLTGPVARPATLSGGELWMPDLGPALERAAAEKKDLLVDFTGSDWCGWCIKLHDEVFGEEEFLEWAQERYVLVALDFPRKPGSEGFERMTDELRARNESQRMAFAVEGFPTILLMSADGVAYARTGYQAGGVEPYIAHLDEFEARDTKAELAAASRVVATLGDDSAEDELEAAYALMGNVVASKHEALMQIVRTHDPEDSRLVLAKAALDTFMEEHLNVEQEPDWGVVVAAIRELPKSTPSIERVPTFFYFRGVIAVEAGERELAEASLKSLQGMEDANPQMIAALEAGLEAMEADAG